MLAALCAGLKEQVVHQVTRIAKLEEDKRHLTKALHRTACAGSCVPEVAYFGAVIAWALIARHIGGSVAVFSTLAGWVLGATCIVLAHRGVPQSTTPRHRAFPAHITEPEDPALFDEPGSIIRPTIRELAEAYADEPEDFHRTDHLPVWADHPDAQAAREEFFATAARLNLERGRFEAADPATT